MKISDLKLAVARKKLLASKVSGSEAKHRKMAILLDVFSEDSFNAFLKLKKDLQLTENELKVIGCGKKGLKNDIFETPVVSLEDLGWNGKVSEEISAFVATEYDILVSFTASENKMADFLVSVTRARLKVGRGTGVKNDLFDLNISAEISEPEIFTFELKKYLKILNTTGE